MVRNKESRKDFQGLETNLKDHHHAFCIPLRQKWRSTQEEKRGGKKERDHPWVVQNKQSHVSSCHTVICCICPMHPGPEADSHPGNVPSTIINSLQNNVLLSCSCKTPSYIFWPLAKASLSLRIPHVSSYYGNLQVDIFLAQRKTVHFLKKCFMEFLPRKT